MQDKIQKGGFIVADTKELNYRIEDDTLIFNPAKTKTLELKQIKKIAKTLGLTIVPEIPEDAEKEEKKKKRNPKITEKEMRAYLEQYATKAQKTEFEKKYNAPLINKKTQKQVITKAGKPRVKGYIAVYQWFIKRFPEYPEAPAEK